MCVCVCVWGGGGVGSGGGHVRCEQRSEVFVKIPRGGRVGGGGRMDVNEELKFL